MNSKIVSDANQKHACLVCGEEATNLKRGLCQRHYEQFRRKRDSLTTDAQDAWEVQLIASGKLLAKQQGKKFGIDDPFAESFNEFVENTPGALKKPAETASGMLDAANKKTKQHRQKPKD